MQAIAKDNIIIMFSFLNDNFRHTTMTHNLGITI